MKSPPPAARGKQFSPPLNQQQPFARNMADPKSMIPIKSSGPGTFPPQQRGSNIPFQQQKFSPHQPRNQAYQSQQQQPAPQQQQPTQQQQQPIQQQQQPTQSSQQPSQLSQPSQQPKYPFPHHQQQQQSSQPQPQQSQQPQYPWSQCTVSNVSPFPRYGHAANHIAARDGEVFVMGGLKGSNVFGDLWVIETGMFLLFLSYSLFLF